MHKYPLLLGLLNVANTSYLTQKIDINYDKRMSPYYISGKTVNVSISLPLMWLAEILEDAQIASWLYSFTVTWQDDRLKYSPRQFGNETRIYVPSTEIWTPRLIVYNSIETKNLLQKGQEDVAIYPDGSVVMQLVQFSRTLCDIWVQRMPFDTQHCALEVASPLQPPKYVSLHGSLVKQPPLMRGNSEFIMRTLAVAELNYTHNGEGMKEISFVAELARCPIYFIVVIVAPSFLISALTVTGILMPKGESGGQDVISVGLSSMLALSITLSIVAENLPRSASVPLIGIYILACLGVCTASVTLGIWLAHLKTRRRPLPSFLYIFAGRCPGSGRKKAEVKYRTPQNEGTTEDSSKDAAKIDRIVLHRLYTLGFATLQLALLAILILFFSFWWREPQKPPPAFQYSTSRIHF
ncbi:unnamed protein product, partial [Mesorhabditis spiculigera]